MIKTYSREIAVQEGVRKNAEINKACIKRPVSKLIGGTVSLRIPKLNENIDPSGYRAKIHDSFDFKNDNKRYNEYKMITAGEYKVKFSDLTELESFKNSTFCVYVEKQHNNIYSLRNLYSDLVDDVVEVELEEFIDIVGKALFINMDKKDGKCKVNSVLRIIKEGQK